MKALSGSNSLIAGVSYGLGQALAYQLAQGGSRVLITARNGEKLEKIAEKTGVKFYPSDLTRETDILLDYFAREIGAIDNLAVLIGGYSQDTISDMNSLDSMLESHVRTTLKFVEKSVKRMKSGSSIVLVSSTQTFLTRTTTDLSYSVSKYALNKATEVLAASLLKSGIRVNAVAPSWEGTSTLTRLPLGIMRTSSPRN